MVARLTIHGLAVVLLLLVAIGAAAEQGPPPSASRSTFVQLMKVQEYWEQEEFEKARMDLEKLLASKDDDPYEFGLVSQYLANTNVLMDRHQEARRVLEAALAKQGIHYQLLANLKMFYGQIVLADEDFELARRMFADWLATTEESPAPSQLFSAAYANYMTGHLDTAEDLIERVMRGKSDVPDAWYRLHYQILFDLERFDDAEGILLGMLNRSPDNEGYWRLLANHHLRREDSRKALAALTVAHQVGVLTKTQDMEHIVALYSFAETPERAARMLDEMLQETRLESDYETLRKLADLWLLSRERKQAIGTLQQAAALAPDGETNELLASLWFEDEQWRDAYGAFLAAIEKGGIEDPYRLYLLAGISAMRAGMPDEARSALLQASKSDTLHSQAHAMLRELDESATGGSG